MATDAQRPTYESNEDSARFYSSLGPWLTAQAVMDYCQITAGTLREWRETNQVLGVEFNDGNFYYPAAQFHDDRPAPGLPAILTVLSRGYRADASRAAWFARHAYIGEEATRWDLLHEGKRCLLIEWAEEDVARITER